MQAPVDHPTDALLERQLQPRPSYLNRFNPSSATAVASLAGCRHNDQPNTSDNHFSAVEEGNGSSGVGVSGLHDELTTPLLFSDTLSPLTNGSSGGKQRAYQPTAVADVARNSGNVVVVVKPTATHFHTASNRAPSANGRNQEPETEREAVTFVSKSPCYSKSANSLDIPSGGKFYNINLAICNGCVMI
jgi:hypothetical protein